VTEATRSRLPLRHGCIGAPLAERVLSARACRSAPALSPRDMVDPRKAGPAASSSTS